MNLTTNLVLALWFTLTLEAPGYSLYIKPSMYFMPKVIFTNQTNWELVKSRNGIKVYSHWVTLCDSWKTRRLQGEFKVNMPLPDLIAILKGGVKVKNWMAGVSESFTFKEQDNTWYSCAKFNIPCSFDDQDLIVENSLNLNVRGNTAYICLKSLPDLLPEMTDLKRMENFSGYWKQVPVSQGVSLVEYAAYSKSEQVVPRFIQDPIVLSTFNSFLGNLAFYYHSFK